MTRRAADSARRRGGGAGFTLVELVIATAVLTVGVYGVYDQFIEARDGGRRLAASVQGRNFAAQKLAELLASPAPALAAWKPPSEFTPSGDSARMFWKAAVAPLPGGAVEVTVTAGWDPARRVPLQFLEGRAATVKGVRIP